MSKHAAEPWSFDKYDNIIAGTETLLLGGIRTPMTAGPRMDEGRTNARRIVACVNACAGVDTDLLEAGELDKPTMLVIQENKDLKHRCDELLAALEGLLADMHLRAMLEGDVDSDGCVVINCGNGVLYAANAAIAKAKGV